MITKLPDTTEVALHQKVALHQQTGLLGKEIASLKKEVRALSGYKDRCEHLQDMSNDLASTAKGNQMLLLNAEKLQLELNSEKDKSFQLETEKSSVEQTVLQLQASSEILGQRNQQLEEELELVRDRMTQLEADLSALKKSVLQNTINGLRADILGLAHSKQTLQQEKQKLALMVKEYELMQEDNTSSVLEEL